MPRADAMFGTTIVPMPEHFVIATENVLYLHDRATGELVHTIEPPIPQISAVISSGNNVILGSEAAVLVYANTGELVATIANPRPGIPSGFGRLVPLGNRFVIQAIYDEVEGAIEAGTIYLHDGATGALIQAIPNPVPRPERYFGVWIIPTGDNFVVADYVDAAFLFDPEPMVDDVFGSVTSLGATSLRTSLIVTRPV